MIFKKSKSINMYTKKLINFLKIFFFGLGREVLKYFPNYQTNKNTIIYIKDICSSHEKERVK